MKKLILISAAVSALVLTGCSSIAKQLGDAGAFTPATCYDANGRQWTGTAACQELARADGAAREKEAMSSYVSGIAQPATDDPAAWDNYYDAVEDGPMKAAMARGGGNGGGSQIRDSQADLARTVVVTSSNEKAAWIGAGAQVATGGLSTLSGIIRSKFAYKERRAMWAAYERPSVSVSGFGGGGSTTGGEGALSQDGTYIVNVDGSVATDGARSNSNQNGVQTIGYDDGAAIGSKRQITDPTFLNGVCDDGDSLCDGGGSFFQQENPTNVDAGLLRR